MEKGQDLDKQSQTEEESQARQPENRSVNATADKTSTELSEDVEKEHTVDVFSPNNASQAVDIPSKIGLNLEKQNQERGLQTNSIMKKERRSDEFDSCEQKSHATEK